MPRSRGDARARDWIRTGQHSSERDRLFQPSLVERYRAEAHYSRKAAMSEAMAYEVSREQQPDDDPKAR